MRSLIDDDVCKEFAIAKFLFRRVSKLDKSAIYQPMSTGIKTGIIFTVMILATVSQGISSLSAQESEVREHWMTMGKTNKGAILSLDVNSIQTKPHAGNWLWFSYRIISDAETLERIGFTGACNRGQVASKPEWQTELTNDKGDLEAVVHVKADSPGSLKLLRTVCSRGYLR